VAGLPVAKKTLELVQYRVLAALGANRQVFEQVLSLLTIDSLWMTRRESWANIRAWEAQWVVKEHRYKVGCKRKDSHGNIALVKAWGTETVETASKLHASPGRIYPFLPAQNATRCSVMLLLCDRLPVQLEQEHMFDRLGMCAALGTLIQHQT
jgi:hypothetical protein